ncbi:TIGR03086 family metal-binding protein [Streptomyces avicenniae]|uniref:TIGR03086 family metal-binding protein n=1 Tax=Streptomyces avicenniae TaxID=500153 RepID=UPI00069CBB6A|nr:TIGR03086 family metal-binding protein [Streptomyces avicenniae]
MELLDGFRQGLDEFGTRVHRVRSEQWASGTPCAEWSVRDLVNHLVSEHLWAPPLLGGATLAEVGDRFDGDVLGDDPVAAWDAAVAASREAVGRPGVLGSTVQTSSGNTPAEEYLRQMTLDLTVHAWDLARGIGADDRLDPGLVALVHDHAAGLVPQWQGVGVFAPPVPVAADAPLQDRLVGLMGRTP